jgi:hypothetical protein
MSLTVDSSKGILARSFGTAENNPFFFAVPVVTDLTKYRQEWFKIN